jgi:hypothetical protein
MHECGASIIVRTLPPFWRFEMVITTAHIAPLVALIAGILILMMPRLLNYIVAVTSSWWA